MELLVFVFFFIAFYAVGMIRLGLRSWRDRRQKRELRTLVRDLRGREIRIAEHRLGPPHEVVDGSSGRSLWVWRSPPNEVLPDGTGLLILSLTVDPGGRITGGGWNRR
jgi:hypothetical protein